VIVHRWVTGDGNGGGARAGASRPDAQRDTTMLPLDDMPTVEPATRIGTADRAVVGHP
jgi:CTP:molybdopterin cytidylyltransferase MocA